MLQPLFPPLCTEVRGISGRRQGAGPVARARHPNPTAVRLHFRVHPTKSRIVQQVLCHGIVMVTGSGVPLGGRHPSRITPSPDPHYRHRFPVEIISHAVWLYHVFSLSLRDVELILADRSIVLSYETVRRWCQRFAGRFADRLRWCRPRPGDKWHLDEVLILSTNSGGRCQSSKAGDACFGPWPSIQPVHGS